MVVTSQCGRLGGGAAGQGATRDVAVCQSAAKLAQLSISGNGQENGARATGR